jgi:hypothetical protein
VHTLQRWLLERLLFEKQIYVLYVDKITTTC